MGYALVLSLTVGFVQQAQFMRGYEARLVGFLLHLHLTEALMHRCLKGEACNILIGAILLRRGAADNSARLSAES